MPLIQFDDKSTDGFYLLITSGEVGHYPDDIYAVSERLLKELDAEFKAKGITYHRLDVKKLNEKLQKARVST